MSLLDKFHKKYNFLWKSIVKPSKKTYCESDLGPSIFYQDNKTILKQNFTLLYNKNKLLPITLYKQRSSSTLPLIIYCHTFQSNKIEGLFLLPYCIKHNYDLVVWDYAGSGNGIGKYITFGFLEQKELRCVIEYTKNHLGYCKIFLWGRSMGASTCIFFLAQNVDLVCGALLDSPFTRLDKTIIRIASQSIQLPNFIWNMVLSVVESTIFKKTGVVISEINPIEYIHKIKKISLLLAVAKKDKLVKPQDIKKMASKTQTNCQTFFFDGDHSSDRSYEGLIKKGFDFFNDCMKNILSDNTINGYHKKSDSMHVDPQHDLGELYKTSKFIQKNESFKLFAITKNSDKNNITDRLSLLIISQTHLTHKASQVTKSHSKKSLIMKNDKSNKLSQQNKYISSCLEACNFFKKDEIGNINAITSNEFDEKVINYKKNELNPRRNAYKIIDHFPKAEFIKLEKKN